MAGSQKVIEIRQLFHLDEFQDVLRLQKEIWAFDDVELLPLRFLVVVSKVGGHVFGAYDGAEMIGFCFAIPGIKEGHIPYLHSHMLGVLPPYRDLGVGRNLKLRQREDALARGIGLIEWTFDPLELKNAFFNIERLGAIVRRYNPNQYGLTASPLHGGLPTDRCYAEWWIDSPRVNTILSGGQVDSSPQLGIAYPADIARIRAEDSARARAIQRENAEKFQSAFAQGLAVTRFQRADAEGAYLLEPWK
ncbi:GCN5-related N-acetyltransferase [Candidatus Sulfopaludibacter sp. SbA3]|nr:GCN5-related N-acetyltransferase [Candidatus Sulfopaludibacter sp. SbA3]